MATKILDSNGVQTLTTKIFTEINDRIDTAINTAIEATTATDDEVAEALDEVF